MSADEPPFISAWDLAPGDRFEWAGLDVAVTAVAPDPRDDRIMCVWIDAPIGSPLKPVRYNRGERIRSWRRDA